MFNFFDKLYLLKNKINKGNVNLIGSKLFKRGIKMFDIKKFSLGVRKGLLIVGFVSLFIML